MDNNSGTFSVFVREHFRLVRIKAGKPVRMGRRTYEWILKQENKSGLNHLTSEKLDARISKYELKHFVFDDGWAYVVKPDVERKVMVEFYQQREEEEERTGAALSEHGVPEPGDDLLDSYGISEAALEELTGDTAADLGLQPDAAVDFISNEMIESGMHENRVRIFVDEGRCVVITEAEEIPEGEIFNLYLTRPLPGTEVPISDLDPSGRTYITGAYRDNVGGGSHDFEHIFTRMED